MHECGLAGAVGSDDAIAVARGEFHVYVLKQYPFAELHAEIIDRYHKFAELEGWNAESDAAALLSGLGIREDKHYTLMKDMSGNRH